jgi:hypothetical protein
VKLKILEKIGIINGKDINTYHVMRKVGSKWDDGDVFDSNG